MSLSINTNNQQKTFLTDTVVLGKGSGISLSVLDDFDLGPIILRYMEDYDVPHEIACEHAT